MSKRRMDIEESNMEILVDTLLSKISELKKEIADLQEVTMDALYSKFKRTKEKAMKEALEKRGHSFSSFKTGDIVVQASGIYLVRTVREDGFGYASAWLTDFCCDNEHVFKMALEHIDGRIELDPSDETRMAGHFEMWLFENELAKVGYHRTDTGNIVKF